MLERIAVGAFAANCLVLPLEEVPAGSPRPCILVDPGAEAERILDFLETCAFLPRLIVCTHGHLDHICAVGPVKTHFEGRGKPLPVAVHREDAGYLGPGGEAKNRALFRELGAQAFFDSLWSPVPEAEILLEEGMFLPGSAWRVIHTPGHSRGSICLYEEKEGLLVSGDTLFRDGVGRTDGPDASLEELRESIAWKLFSLPPGTRVFPGHGEPTSIGRERGED